MIKNIHKLLKYSLAIAALFFFSGCTVYPSVSVGYGYGIYGGYGGYGYPNYGYGGGYYRPPAYRPSMGRSFARPMGRPSGMSFRRR